MTGLEAAVGRGDKAEVARWAERLGTARLARLLQSDDRGAVLAALEGTRQLEGNVRLMSSVTRLLSDSDARVAERAAATLGELLRADRLGKLLEWEISAPEVADACSSLARTADRAAAPLPLRVAALDALAEGHAFCRVSIPARHPQRRRLARGAAGGAAGPADRPRAVGGHHRRDLLRSASRRWRAPPPPSGAATAWIPCARPRCPKRPS